MNPTINRSSRPLARSGFSLIELLVTVALVSFVLGGVLVPAANQMDLWDTEIG